MTQVFLRDGMVVLALPDGEVEISPYTAHYAGYALMECSRIEASTWPGDPKRSHVWECPDAVLPTPRFGDDGGGSRVQGDDRPAGDEAV